MTLESGARLGPYEVIAPIAAGGMGQVFKAKDTRLERVVAVKILPEHLAATPELRERFEREARAISSLSHPNICTLFDIGREGDVNYLVMEFLEGETLSERLKRGRPSRDECFRWGIQMADALDKAHRRGIVHRDLKPGNVVLTKTGAKLVDFGLAARRESSGVGSSSDSVSPTREQPLTSEGAVLGTFQYMAPEQLAGKEADARADVYALGAILYEMFTGKKAFDDRGATLEPRALDHLVKTCLARDPDERRQAAYDVRLDLEWIEKERPELVASAPSKMRILAGAALGLVLGAVAMGWFGRGGNTETRSPTRFVAAESELVLEGELALSRDGRVLVFPQSRAPDAPLMRRNLDDPEPAPIRGTEGGRWPFLSPDGESLAFSVQGVLTRVPLSGGPAIPISDAAMRVRDATWQGNTIVAARSEGGLVSTTPSGGAWTSLSEGVNERWAQILPGEKVVLLTEEIGENFSYVRSIETGERRLLTQGEQARYVSAGYLLFVRDGMLWASRFDLDRLAIVGEPTPFIENVSTFSVSGEASDVLAYTPASSRQTILVSLDREGRELGRIGEPGDYLNPELSPDGRKLAIRRDSDFWLYDLEQDVSSRFTFREFHVAAVWSPDGSEIVFNETNADGFFDLYRKPSNGLGEAQRVLESEAEAHLGPLDWGSDGTLVYLTGGLSDRGIAALPPEGDPFVFVDSEYDEYQARLSPNGRWIAYVSNESGGYEVFVRSFPQHEGEWQVSSGGGVQPRWAPDGTELFYIDPHGRLVSVPVAAGDEFSTGTASVLFQTDVLDALSIEAGVRAQYDVAPDAQSFVFVHHDPEAGPTPIYVVLDWLTELREKLE